MILKKQKTIITHTEDYEELLGYATKMGCKTAIDFVMFLKARESILSL